MKAKLVTICGATATGKSAVAIALAQRLGAAIVGADSRQVYRELDIGTAKPSLEEQQTVPHYMIDVCQPTETMTLAMYQEQVRSLLDAPPQSLCADLPFLLVGGTGLYIKAVVRGMKIPRVPPQPDLRSQLAQLGQMQCYAMLQQVDPAAATKIHANDAVRTLRALEVFYVTGLPISQQQGEHPPDQPILQIGMDSEQLGDRIARRTATMLDMGLVAEVERLGRTYGFDLPLLNTLGYAEIKQYLAGKISLTQAQADIVQHTRQFAKRQRTWFRADPDIEWFDADASDVGDRIWQRIQPFLAASCFQQK